MIKSIEIENVKGLGSKKFELDILPNHPSLLVAPNGFGKSSFACAFKSMNSNRILLHEDNFHNADEKCLPKIVIKYLNPDNNTITLEANRGANTISSEFDYFVINNQVKPKGVGNQYGRPSARLEINDIVLVDRIPSRATFNYSFTKMKAMFGDNGKIFPNAKLIFTNHKVVQALSDKYSTLQKTAGKRVQASINSIFEEFNKQKGDNATLINWFEQNKLEDLSRIDSIREIAEVILQFDIPEVSPVISYMYALQLTVLFNEEPEAFKKACTYSNYTMDKKSFDSDLATFDCTWKRVRTSETGNKLVVKFPHAKDVSNGQRDILTFLSMLFQAKRRLNKQANILIIDEVFDYLDDANLIAAQYYVTKLIKEYKTSHRRIYPLILTHLNPNYFKNFAFKDQKVYFLNNSTIQVNQHFIKLLKNRDTPSIKDDVSKLLFHYNPLHINKRTEFRALGLKELWGEGNNFRDFLNEEAENYLNDRPFCPFAVCGAVRLKIEEIAYNKLQNPDSRIEFIDTKLTRAKLEKAESRGINSPQSHYLLGIIYNDGMHWKENVDNVSPIASKLEHMVIRKLISDILNS